MTHEQLNGFQLPDFDHSPIDLHCHFNHGSPYDCAERDIHRCDFEFVRHQHARAGVHQVGISTFASVCGNTQCICGENRYLYDLSKENPWIYPWVVVDPRQEETYRQAEQLLADPKVLGIKVHPDYHGYDIREHGDSIFSFADRHSSFVLMHPQHIADMPSFADQYPNMKLIIAHLGSVEHVDAIANAKHGNIYTDTSGGASSFNNILEYAVGRIGSERIFFGTDNYSYAFQFGRVALAELSAQDKENILYKNALREFPQAFA